MTLVCFPAQATAPLVLHVRESIVRIETGIGTCTGFVVGLTRIVTAEHCVNDTPITVSGQTSSMRWVSPARVIKVDEDFALLDIHPMDLKPLMLAKDVKQGDEIFTFGFARGSRLIVYSRLVADRNDGMLVLDGPITPGMSGGPVINAQGEVVGLNQSTLSDRGFASDLADVKRFLK